LMIRDQYDVGLEHIVAKSPIERDLDDIAPGQTREIFITLRVAQPGRWCQHVTVTGNGGLVATTEACVQAERIEVQPAPRPEVRPTPAPRGPLEPAPEIPTGQPGLEVTKTGPRRLQVGEKAEFFIHVRNTGEVPLTNVRIVDGYELALDPVNATDGFTVGREELIWVLPRLGVGSSYRLQVNCECVAPAARACNRVTDT